MPAELSSNEDLRLREGKSPFQGHTAPRHQMREEEAQGQQRRAAALPAAERSTVNVSSGHLGALALLGSRHLGSRENDLLSTFSLGSFARGSPSPGRWYAPVGGRPCSLWPVSSED